MYLISFYVPAAHLESVKNALFAASAGTIGHYSHCAWQVEGQGQYMPLEGSDPYQGTAYQIETAVEFKVELVCEESKIEATIAALKLAHPYETPAYHVLKLEEF